MKSWIKMSQRERGVCQRELSDFGPPAARASTGSTPKPSPFGELVQMDASIHDWLKGRGEGTVLVTMIDDATNRVLARFYEGETVSIAQAVAASSPHSTRDHGTTSRWKSGNSLWSTLPRICGLGAPAPKRAEFIARPPPGCS